MLLEFWRLQYLLLWKLSISSDCDYNETGGLGNAVFG